jgi:hypothetical protein
MPPRLGVLAGWLVLAACVPASAQDPGPLVTDFNGPRRPPVHEACARCGVVHDAYVGCVQAYKAFNGLIESKYKTQNWIYGYYDYAYGRGPVITLGSRAMVPGFRGFGLLGSPGYGAGQKPVSRVDLEVLGGWHYPEARGLWPRWP